MADFDAEAFDPTAFATQAVQAEAQEPDTWTAEARPVASWTVQLPTPA